MSDMGKRQRRRERETELKVVRVPVYDTGIGREQGYANDEEFVKAAVAEREEMLKLLTPKGRAMIEEAEQRAQHELIFGKDHPDE